MTNAVSRSWLGPFFPPNLTDALQPIDAGYGRSLRCAVGRALDRWLECGDNIEKWETNMPPRDRRILMTRLVADATEEVLKMDDMRIGCFNGD